MPIRRIGDPIILNSTATGDQYRPSATVLSDGRLAVAWSSAETGGATRRWSASAS